MVAVASPLTFRVSFTGAYANDFFNQGKVYPLTGANAGCQPVEIFDWASDGSIELFAPLTSIPVIGDTFTIENGCSKARQSSDPSIPTCLGYDNVINFRGFPEVPGSDQVLRATVPGGGGE